MLLAPTLPRERKGGSRHGRRTPPKVAFLEINSPLAVNVVFVVGGGEMGRPSPQVPAIPIKPNERELKRFFAFLEKKGGRRGKEQSNNKYVAL